MTMIVAVATPRFAMIVADRLARTEGPTVVQIGHMRVEAAGGLNIEGFQKLHHTADASGIIGVAGNANWHAEYLEGAKALSRCDCDDFVFERLCRLPKFRELGVMPPAEGIVEQVLHVYRSGERFIMTRMEGSIIHVTRSSVRSTVLGAEAMMIGSGAGPASSLMAGVPLATNWWELKNSTTATPADFLNFFKPLFAAVSAFGDVSATVVGWTMDTDGVWRQMP